MQLNQRKLSFATILKDFLSFTFLLIPYYPCFLSVSILSFYLLFSKQIPSRKITTYLTVVKNDDLWHHIYRLLPLITKAIHGINEVFIKYLKLHEIRLLLDQTKQYKIHPTQHHVPLQHVSTEASNRKKNNDECCFNLQNKLVLRITWNIFHFSVFDDT